jgi:hypothetical protein
MATYNSCRTLSDRRAALALGPAPRDLAWSNNRTARGPKGEQVGRRWLPNSRQHPPDNLVTSWKHSFRVVGVFTLKPPGNRRWHAVGLEHTLAKPTDAQKLEVPEIQEAKAPHLPPLR